MSSHKLWKAISTDTFMLCKLVRLKWNGKTFLKIIHVLFFLWHTSKFFLNTCHSSDFVLTDELCMIPMWLCLLFLHCIYLCKQACVCVFVCVRVYECMPFQFTWLAFSLFLHIPAICHTVARSVAVLVFVGQLCDEDVTLQCKARFSFMA